MFRIGTRQVAGIKFSRWQRHLGCGLERKSNLAKHISLQALLFVATGHGSRAPVFQRLASTRLLICKGWGVDASGPIASVSGARLNGIPTPEAEARDL